jgi:hypothetical protein
MSSFSPRRFGQPVAPNGDGPVSAVHAADVDVAPDIDADNDWADDDALGAELERLAAAHKELLAAAGVSREQGLVESQEENAGTRETAQLRAENGRLRTRLEELERQLQLAGEGREQAWREQQREYETLLEEKSEVIRGLHLQIQELKAEPPQQAGAELPGPALALREELEHLRNQLEQERRQLEEDEHAVEQQMKQMELTLSRERVELARQRAELQRMQNDFQHELETAARDDKLRERLLPLQRRHQEIVNSKGAAAAPPPRPTSSGQLPRPASTGHLPRPATAAQLNMPAPSDPTPLPKRPSSGLLRRLFGKGE